MSRCVFCEVHVRLLDDGTLQEQASDEAHDAERCRLSMHEARYAYRKNLTAWLRRQAVLIRGGAVKTEGGVGRAFDRVAAMIESETWKDNDM